LGLLVSGALGGAAWFIFDSLDKQIPRSKAQLRKLSEGIRERVGGFSNMIGLQPALSPAVGLILDEASAIYLKHANVTEAKLLLQGETRFRAVQALEEAMARMLELGQPKTAQEQDLELASGWALPLLQEMRDMDMALNQHMQAALAAQAINTADPLANLRDARKELLGDESALEELRQSQQG
jgi:hypothetical protein